jgi:EpsI family protein
MTRRVSVVAAVFVLLAAWTHARPRAVPASAVDVGGLVPLAFGGWIGRDAPPLDPAVARVLAADRYVHRYYGWKRATPPVPEGGSRIADVETDIAYYARPQAGAAMHSPLACLPGNGWQVIDSATASLTVAGRPVTVRRLTVGRAAERVAMTYWFQNRGAIIGNEYAQRLQMLKQGLTGRPADAALVRVMARDTADGRIALDRFSRDLAALLAAGF